MFRMVTGGEWPSIVWRWYVHMWVIEWGGYLELNCTILIQFYDTIFASKCYTFWTLFKIFYLSAIAMCIITVNHSYTHFTYFAQNTKQRGPWVFGSSLQVFEKCVKYNWETFKPKQKWNQIPAHNAVCQSHTYHSPHHWHLMKSTHDSHHITSTQQKAVCTRKTWKKTR